MSKNKIGFLLTYIVIVLVAGLATFASSYVTKRIKISENVTLPTPTPQFIEKPSQYPDYDAIKGSNPDKKINVVKFTSDCQEGGCINNKPASSEFDGIKKKYSIDGDISRGYLYLELAVDYNRPLTSYDDFYFTLNYTGGHLQTGENLLPIPSSEISRYLYDLRSITYSYRQRVFRNVNFLNLLQNSKVFNIHASVSSDRPGRVLKEVSIYYQCAEGNTCIIKEIKDK